jgi:hypothetical protein
MAQKSFPWTDNGTGDGTAGGYTALEWGEIWRKAFLGGSEASQGVCKGTDNELAVTGTASPVAVNTGAAFVYGKFYQNTASVNLTVSTPLVNTTGGHVILRLDWAAQTVRLVAVSNTDGVATIPSLTQSLSTQWEIRLASYTITTGGVITLTDARGYVHMAQRVATANIDDAAVTTAKIADSNVTTAKIADANVTTAKIADANVTTAKLASSAVDENKVATSVAGNGLAGGAGSALSVNVDGSTIEISSDSLRVKDGGISTAKLAANSVDDTIAGNRVPQFYRRKGGNASVWSIDGSTDYTPGAVRMQAGAVQFTAFATSATTQAVTFPVAFSQAPLIFITQQNQPTQDITLSALVSAGSVTIYATNWGLANDTVVVNWLAIGPE